MHGMSSFYLCDLTKISTSQTESWTDLQRTIESKVSKVLPQFSPEGLAYQGEFQQIHSPHSRDLRKLRNHKNPTEVQEDDTTK
ncbi:hypothetical protein RJ640_003327 [Escallonia rubra]|uniref:Uncharacterized protein n=1 Tax=Escallonia rubra TaxID=112253 RepID=A0AA88R3A4_9ASTE|nr:hypothetical protein RJ640_003327 [Escallonia rubra]